MEKDLNHQGRQGEDRGDGIRRRPKEERQQTARRRPVEESGTQERRRRPAGESGTQEGRRRPAGESGTQERRRRPAGESGTQERRRRPVGESGTQEARRRPVGESETQAGQRRQENDRRGQSPNSRKQNPNAKNKKKKRAAFNVGSTAVLIVPYRQKGFQVFVAVFVFVFSVFQLVTMLVPYYSGGAEYDKIKEIAIKTNEQGEGFSVDFDALRAENPDTVAWIRFDEPSIISYPVVKSSDNKEYLTKTFSANDNKLGAIFMDMRCDSDFADRNTMIYGHNLKIGGEMFSQLKEYESEDFCKAHPEFYIYTPDGKVRMYKVFAASVVKDTSDAYNLTYNSDEEFESYLNLCRESSNYQVDVEVNAQSQIVSLSTCTNVKEDERFLLQGVLAGEY